MTYFTCSEQKLCWNIKSLRYFVRDCLKDFLRLPISVRLYETSKNLLLRKKQCQICNWKLSNLAICHISVALNITFNSKKGVGDTKNFKNCNFQGVWTKISNENVFVRNVIRTQMVNYWCKNLRFRGFQDSWNQINVICGCWL